MMHALQNPKHVLQRQVVRYFECDTIFEQLFKREVMHKSTGRKAINILGRQDCDIGKLLRYRAMLLRRWSAAAMARSQNCNVPLRSSMGCKCHHTSAALQHVSMHTKKRGMRRFGSDIKAKMQSKHGAPLAVLPDHGSASQQVQRSWLPALCCCSVS